MPYKDKDKKREHDRRTLAARRENFFRDKKCVECGSTEQLELDHINRAEKVTHRIWSYSLAKREAELAKCQVLCKACHREKTMSVDIPDYLGRPIHQHGTKVMYSKHGCRCDDCTAANAKAQRERRARRRSELDTPTE